MILLVFSQQNLGLNVDYSRYRGDSSNVYLEIYYSFSEQPLSLHKTDKGYEVSALFTAQVKKQKSDSVIAIGRWRIPKVYTDTVGRQPQNALAGLYSFFIPAGEYDVCIKVEDEFKPSFHDSLSIPMQSILFTDKSLLGLSDVELCSSIKSDGAKESPFYKNTLEVIPNPIHYFGVGMPILFYYVEVYNLNANTSEKNFYTQASVFNAMGREVISQKKSKPRHNESSVEAGTINISKLPNGTYTFLFSINDSLGGKLAVSGKKFFIYNPGIVDTTKIVTAFSGVSSSVYATMDEEELNREFEVVSYLYTGDDKSHYQALAGVDAKRNFMYNFWRVRDTSASMTDFKSEYLKRVEYANQNFRAMGRKGFKTDRGRVYIIYGPPDDVERHPNGSNERPYEIWTYQNIQGGVIFVFADQSGFSDYILVHSTHQNELHDDNWQDKVTVN